MIKEFYSNKSVQDQGFSKNLEDEISNYQELEGFEQYSKELLDIYPNLLN